MSYKLVRCLRHEYISALIGPKHRLSVIYPIREWVKPTFPSLVFKDYMDAARWSKYILRYNKHRDEFGKGTGGELQLWRCQTEGLREISWLPLVREFLNVHDIHSFWNQVLASRHSPIGMTLGRTPAGTYAATAVKLTMRMPWNLPKELQGAVL